LGLLLVVFAIYLAPTLIAFFRGHPNRWLILVVNVIFGATLLAWLICLVWSFHGFHRPREGSNGGQSGLNLFVNDERRIRLLGLEALGNAPDPTAQLSRLTGLLESGAISTEEHAALRKKILSGFARG